MTLQCAIGTNAGGRYPGMSRAQFSPIAVRPSSVSQALPGAYRHRNAIVGMHKYGSPTSLTKRQQHPVRCRAASSAHSSTSVVTGQQSPSGAADKTDGTADGGVEKPPDSTLGDYWQLLLPDWTRLLACAAFTLLSVVCTISIGPAIGQGESSFQTLDFEIRYQRVKQLHAELALQRTSNEL